MDRSKINFKLAEIVPGPYFFELVSDARAERRDP